MCSFTILCLPPLTTLLWQLGWKYRVTYFDFSLVPRPRPAFRRFLYGLSVLKATESWAGPGNEATLTSDLMYFYTLLILYVCVAVWLSLFLYKCALIVWLTIIVTLLSCWQCVLSLSLCWPVQFCFCNLTEHILLSPYPPPFINWFLCIRLPLACCNTVSNSTSKDNKAL